MQYYFAPLEGLTDSIYRKLHHKYFPGVHRYYTPFFSPTIHRCLTPRESRELPTASSLDHTVIPQILTKVPEDFLWLANVCHDLGYQEVNWNLGCPSGTVTAKGKGAGMLLDPEQLDRFLWDVFDKTPIPISIKTRIGFTSPKEFPRLMEIFNQYPIHELIVHPRTRVQFYKGNVDMDAFRYSVNNSKAPVCYNGNLTSKQDISNFSKDFPEIGSVMIGRALIGDPGMLSCTGTTPELLEQFHEELLDQYTIAFGGSRNAMFRLKENWRHLLCKFENSEKLGKALRKATDLAQYKSIIQEIIHTLPMRETLLADW